MSEFTRGEWGVTELSSGLAVYAKNEGHVETVADCFHNEGNARLIAAAPEMYELLRVWTEIQAQPTLMNAQKRARDLLARIDSEECYS